MDFERLLHEEERRLNRHYAARLRNSKREALRNVIMQAIDEIYRITDEEVEKMAAKKVPVEEEEAKPKAAKKKSKKKEATVDE